MIVRRNFFNVQKEPHPFDLIASSAATPTAAPAQDQPKVPAALPSPHPESSIDLGR
jgi:hypothetical protein